MLLGGNRVTRRRRDWNLQNLGITDSAGRCGERKKREPESEVETEVREGWKGSERDS